MGDEPVRVFMSYRRADDRHFIGRLHDQLCGAFGDDMVFRDIDSIPAGTNFRAVILRTLNEVDAVVAVIGPHWARNTVDTTSDYVYLELAEAMQQNKLVIPVLMEQTAMPAPDTLPADLRPLTEINAISVQGDPAFRRDSARLIDVIRDLVARDRARLADERRAAEELARRVDAERQERERLAEELRAEERATRRRLAELEEAAARRQIEIENARLAEIAEKLRLTEPDAIEQPKLVQVVETVETVETVEADEQPTVEEPADVVHSPRVTASVEPAAARTGGRSVPAQRLLQGLIVVALVLGMVAMFVDRTYRSAPFDELSSSRKVDVTAWIFALVVGVPLLLRRWPGPQQRVLIGVTVSTFFFVFLQGSVVLRYGTTGYDEGTWFTVRLLQSACLLGACWSVRHGAGALIWASRSVRVVLTALAAVCGVLLTAATVAQWDHSRELIDTGYVADRTPLAVWLAGLVLGPIVITVGLAARRSTAAHLTLATIATLSTVAYLSQTFIIDEVFDSDGSRWARTAVAYIPLAAVAWSTATRAARPGDPARHSTRRSSTTAQASTGHVSEADS